MPKAHATRSTKEEIGFVFLHGAGYKKWIWDKVISKLNYPTLAIDFPGRGDRQVSTIKDLSLSDYTQSALDDIQSFKPKKLIIVAHSFSGNVALDIASKIPERVQSMVFVSASAPKSGQSYLSLLPFPQQLVLRIILALTSGRPPASAIKQECKGVDAKAINKIIDEFVTESPHIWKDNVTWELPKKINTYYVRDESDFPHDHTITNLHPKEVFHVKTGHLSMLSKPEEIIAILQKIV